MIVQQHVSRINELFNIVYTTTQITRVNYCKCSRTTLVGSNLVGLFGEPLSIIITFTYKLTDKCHWVKLRVDLWLVQTDTFHFFPIKQTEQIPTKSTYPFAIKKIQYLSMPPYNPKQSYVNDHGYRWISQITIAKNNLIIILHKLLIDYLIRYGWWFVAIFYFPIYWVANHPN